MKRRKCGDKFGVIGKGSEEMLGNVNLKWRLKI